MAIKRKGLGRGLEALIRDTSPAENTPEPAPTDAPEPEDTQADALQRLPIALIHRSPWQPRREFAAEALEDLARSVREKGVLQPLLVRKVEDHYELIAGERRFRAAHMAELREVPVVVMEVSDREALELALVENLQRADLNLIEEAEGYHTLMDKFELTQEQVAQRVGKARATVANVLRLLDLPDSVKRMVAERTVSPGHAKVLLSLANPKEQEKLATRVAVEQLPVRALERIVAAMKAPPAQPRPVKADIPDSHLQYISERLHHQLGTRVHITPCKTLGDGRKLRGQISVDFYSNEDLDRLLALLGVSETM